MEAEHEVSPSPDREDILSPQGEASPRDDWEYLPYLAGELSLGEEEAASVLLGSKNRSSVVLPLSGGMMSGRTGWNEDVLCPRWVKTGETKKYETEDFIYPDGIRYSELSALPEHVADTYVECSGSVHVRGYHDPGQLSGPPEDCYPPEGENEVGSCDACGSDNWTEEEERDFERTVREEGGDAGYYDGPDTIEEYLGDR